MISIHVAGLRKIDYTPITRGTRFRKPGLRVLGRRRISIALLGSRFS
jgi:hypothetical protein